MTHVRDERQGHHSHLEHMFANAALAIPNHFKDLPTSPEIPLKDLKMEHLTLSQKEYDLIADDCVSVVAETLSK